MANNVKKYYWLKLQKDFFKRHDIKIIESMPNGKDYIIFYMKLLVESISHEGQLRFSETIPYNEEMLSTITDTNIDIVRSAVKIFSELHLMELWDDGTYYMAEVKKMIGSETGWAEKKRLYREKKKQELLDGGQKEDMSDKSKSIELEKELESEKEITLFGEEGEKVGTYNGTDVIMPGEVVAEVSSYPSVFTSQKQYNAYLEVVEFWNSNKVLSKVNSHTTDRYKAFIKAYKELKDINVIKERISRYAIVLNDSVGLSYKWKFELFMKQKNAIKEFADDGKHWENYLIKKGGVNKPEWVDEIKEERKDQREGNYIPNASKDAIETGKKHEDLLKDL